MIQHTPGPWEIDTRHGITSGPCRIRMPEPPTAKNMETALANARLIAAAPEMLEALKAIMKEYREGYGLRCVEQIRAAIAKATGE